MSLVFYPTNGRFLCLLIYFGIGLEETVKSVEVEPDLIPFSSVLLVLRFVNGPISFAAI